MRKAAAKKKIYGEIDPRELPIYPVVDVAHYLSVSYHTLYGWLRPAQIETEIGFREQPLIKRASNSYQLSFVNLIEAHVVKALITAHNVPLNELRAAVERASRVHQISRPLASDRLQSGLGWVFIEEYGALINLGKGGQLALSRILEKYLERVEFEQNEPTRLFPFVKGSHKSEVSISPYVAFGKPVVSERAIRTSVIAQRYEFGETEHELSEDYEISEGLIEEAIIYECAA